MTSHNIGTKLKNPIYLSWVKFSSRSDSTAHFVGAKSFHVQYVVSRKPFLLPIKYALAFIKTTLILAKERPKFIFVQNPPIIPVIMTWVYCKFTNSKFIVDSHCGIFTRKRWRLFLPLYYFLAREATINILHNDHLAEKVTGVGAITVNLGDVPRQMNTSKRYPVSCEFNLLVVNSFSSDEPLDAILDATRALPGVQFYITGSLKRAPNSILNQTFENVVFTDFIPDDEYAALLSSCDAVICLTKDDNTNQSGAYEAMAIGKPIITSDWQLLKDTYSHGTFHVNNTTEGLVEAVNQLQSNYDFYCDQVKYLKQLRMNIWNKNFKELMQAIEDS